jgi:hypothetical protein
MYGKKAPDIKHGSMRLEENGTHLLRKDPILRRDTVSDEKHSFRCEEHVMR